jgi:hypothetical protein
MIAKKITFKVFIEVLSVDAVPALLQEVAQEVLRENTSGHLNKGDGDSSDWGYEEQQVTI